MTDVDWLWREVRATSAGILRGDISERQGAGRIWALLADARYPDELHEVRVRFVGPLSELQDDPDGEHTEAYVADIREAAERFAQE